MVRHWLRRQVSRKGESGALEEQGGAVREQLGGLRGEGDREELAVAVDLVTQEFLWGEEEGS